MRPTVCTRLKSKHSIQFIIQEFSLEFFLRHEMPSLDIIKNVYNSKEV